MAEIFNNAGAAPLDENPERSRFYMSHLSPNLGELPNLKRKLDDHTTNEIDDDCFDPDKKKENRFKKHYGNSPVYPGCKSTKLECAMMLLFLMIFHNASYPLIKDIMAFGDMLLLEGYCFPGSLYFFREFFTQSYSFKRQHYCSKCKKCVSKNFCCMQKSSDFVYFPIESQLQTMFKREKFRNMIFERFQRKKKNSLNYESIMDGSIYKKFSDFLSTPEHFSLSLYTDGVQIFECSSTSMWPIYLSFNELPYKERNKPENMLFLGMWWDGKPDFNAFLWPSVEDFIKLRDFGLPVFIKQGGVEKEICVRGILINCHGDSPARADILCMKNHNAYSGCLVCHQSAVHDPDSGTNTLIYKYQEIDAPLRTSEETVRFANHAEQMGLEHFKGVKGKSVLSKIMGFYVEGTSPDVMHCIYSGIVKKMLNLLFSPEYKSFDFSMFAFLSLADKYFCNAKRANFMTRAPRSIKNFLAYFTTAELKNFMTYYALPLFNQINMPEHQLQHFALLVEAVFLLSQDSISHKDIEDATALLHLFVKKFADIYGTKFMSSNFHLVLHLPDTVRKFGPLFETTCFPKEALNGILKARIVGTRFPEMKICEYFCMVQNFPIFMEKILPPTSHVHQFVNKIKTAKQARVLENISANISALGLSYRKGLDESVRAILKKAIDNSSNFTPSKYKNISLFTKLQINKTIFSSKLNKCDKSTISYCIEYGKNCEVGLVEYYFKAYTCDCTIDCTCPGDYYGVIEMFRKSPIKRLHSLLSFSNMLIPDHNFVCINVKDITTMCVYNPFEDDEDLYYTKRGNTTELE